MFAVNPRTVIVIRVSLIAAMLLHAVVPTTAIAMSGSASASASEVVPVEHGNEGVRGAIPPVPAHVYSSANFQEPTPVVSPTVTETPSPETDSAPLPLTETETPTPSTAEETLTPTSAETVTDTPKSAESLTPAVTATISGDEPSLSFQFTAQPKQAVSGDTITFTLEVVNTGQIPVTGIQFSNVIPEVFTNFQTNVENVVFDSQTRELIVKGENDSLAAGEKLVIQYTAVISTEETNIQLVDTASLSADGLKEPLTAEAALLLGDLQSSLTALDSKGGEAIGLDGQVKVTLPEHSLEGASVVMIQDLRSDSQPAPEGEPWLVFELQVQTAQLQDIQLLNLPAQSVETPIVEGLGGDISETDGNTTVEPSLTPVPAETNTPVPDGKTASMHEKDRFIPFEPVEAAFTEPVELTVSLDGLTDLNTLTADKTPFLVTLDEASGTWVRVPLDSIDRETNSVTAKLNHFSTWGIGIGYALPQNGAGVLLFDQAYTSLFTGTSQYSIPIWTPPGRNGMAPSLSLSYSSATANGLLGDIQAPWVGMGWNVDSVEIARKITNGACSPCGSGSYGYENKFLLLFNGTGYELIADGTTPGRFHTKSESFLYIQRHNNNLSNNSPTAQNATSEWWEVVEKDGTRWRLGWTADAEQLAAMKGYPGAASGAWAALGYAGSTSHVVASRWRADQVVDTFGNKMTFTYFEQDRAVNGAGVNYNRSSYLDTITYTAHTSGTPTAGYSIVFDRIGRSGNEVPSPQTDWDNWDTHLLDKIQVKYGANVIRTYDLSYTVRSYSDNTTNWQTTVLDSVAISGGGVSAPTITFSYTDKDNRAVQNSTSVEWAYPRLQTVANGWEATSTYTYGNDGRPYTSWYNWRVEAQDVADGVGASPMKTTYTYSSPCYKDATAGWCNGTNVGELIGYGQTTATTKDFNGTTTLAIAVHKFYTDEQKAGREYEVQYQNASATILNQINRAYTVVTSGLPTGGYFTYASAVEEYLRTTSLTLVRKTEYNYSSTTGNLNWVKEYDGTPTLYRQTDYEYVTNTSASVWILDTVSRVTLKDLSQAIFSEQRFGYDGSLPGSGSPTTGKLTLSRQVNGSQTIDTAYVYDTYGNVTETRLYTSYGNISSPPSGSYNAYGTVYDTSLKTYPTSKTTPLIPATGIGYDYGLGLPTTMTDPNGNTTTTAYDGLGRVTSITYPGSGLPNIKYTYPTPAGSPLAVSAPFSVMMEILDETLNPDDYRETWQMLDGLGRTIQTQSPYETSGYLVLNDVSYDARGQTLYQGLPRTISGTGGSHFAPSWGSVPHSTSAYDALGRVISVTYADSSVETFSYSGLRTTTVDRNNHQKIGETDAFGRLVKVEEYTGSGSYSLYATTTYEYDVRDLLKKVIDAAGNQTTIGYNGFGRKDAMTDPDMGSWSYGYSVLGNLTSQTDARNCVITIGYDNLNRPLTKTYTGPGACDSTPDVTYTYDSTTGGNEGLGRRTGMSNANSSTTYFYNVLGQMTNETLNMESTNYSLSATFDALGRTLTQTLPNSETLTYSYNAMGALSGLGGTNTYLSNIHYAPSGQVTDQQLGSGLIQQSCYETDTLRLSNLRVYAGSLQTCGTGASNLKLDLTYAYQPNGNVSQIVDGTRIETITYTYDELDRLLGAGGPYEKNQSYNTIGNLISGSGVLAVSPGAEHTCVLMASGGVKCWGRNNEGQLGDGTTTNRTSPADVSGLTTSVAAISSGIYHTCALTAAGGVKCWGDNSSGQLGDGTTTDRTTPVNVSGLTSGVQAISSGGYHTCALLTTGGVKCWGENSDGQVGDGTTTDRNTPVSVSGLTSGIQSIDAGGWHTCAVTTGGGAKCWGDNAGGQVGDGTFNSPRTTPLDVSGLTSGVASITAGGIHTCVVTTSGGAKCWGDNYEGQVGDGTTTSRNTPVNVSGLTSGVVSITAGGWHTCALTTSGGLKCWGDNGYGQVGDGTTTERTTPVDVSGSTSNIMGATAGVYHSCELVTNGALKCWGVNLYGQLGYSAVGYSPTPNATSFSTSTTYTYGDSAHVHAVTSLSTGETYTYDANGNMTQRVEDGQTYTQVFDAENRLISVTVSGQTTQFLYDGDGNLVKKVNPDGSRTLYVGGIYEVDKSSGGTVTRTVTYYPGGAMRINSTLYYILKDHLGSASVVTDASGNVVGEQRYYPFGETRLSTGTIFTDKLFTGQREMAGLGIYHYNARFYSPKLGRFLSADTIVPNSSDPQDMNRYSYVGNSPLNYTDPTGHVRTEGGWRTTPKTPTPCTSCDGGGGGGGGGGDGGGLGDGGIGGNSGGSNGGGGCDLTTNTNSSGEYCHDYTTTTVVCPAALNCQPEDMQVYLTQFQYPGQLPWNPVQNQGSYTVFPFNLSPALGYLNPALQPLSVALDQIISPYGAIIVDIEEGGLAATNYTKPTHIFHQGQVDNELTQLPDGSWVISSHGTGTNSSQFVAVVNQVIGQATFEAVNAMMAGYVFVDQVTGALP